MKITVFQLLLCLCSLIQIDCTAQNNAYSSQANKFLNTLSENARSKAVYDFKSDERYNWHFVPKNDRKGITLNEMNDAQKQSALALLKLYLSDTAFLQGQEIMKLENVLHQLENRKPGDKYRDPGNYAIIFFGEPSNKNAWGWRFEGHHISFNFSTINNRIVSGTPSFLGSNPAVILTGPEKGKEILKNETHLGFALIHSFTKGQLTKAIISTEAPPEIITGNSRTAMIENPQGIFYSDLNKEQQKLFLQLLSVYVDRYSQNYAADMMEEIEQADLNKLQFAWSGSTQQASGSPYYYRLQGPTLIIEYDNSQNNANHIHTVVRDLKHDFGGDELLKHYKEDHSTGP